MTPALAAYGLYRFYHRGDAEVAALRGVDLTIAPGEFVALVGPSGSGKSTLIACVAGLDEPDGGSVTVNGQRLSRRPEAEKARLRARHIGLLMQTGNLLDHLSVLDNVNLQRRLAGTEAEGSVVALLEALGLGEHAHHRASQLSGGEAARAGLAVALSANAALLVCDEPTAEVDAETETLIVNQLRAQLARGAGVLVATHSQALSGLADRVVTLNDGLVVQ